MSFVFAKTLRSRINTNSDASSRICWLGANSGTRLSDNLPPRVNARGWSFWEPGLPQSFFVSREVFGSPMGYQGFEIGNT